MTGGDDFGFNSYELVNWDWTNSKKDKDKVLELVVKFYFNNSLLPPEYEEELFNCLKTIFRSNCMIDLLRFFSRYKAATFRTLEHFFPQYSKQQLYNALNRLINLGLVKVPIKGVPRRRRGGPIPRIYAIIGYEPEDISRAREMDMNMNIPGLPNVERLTQLILEEYFEPKKTRDISIEEVRYILRRYASDYYSRDLVELVIYRLEKIHHKRVWR